jgi:hypothetical protein
LQKTPEPKFKFAIFHNQDAPGGAVETLKRRNVVIRLMIQFIHHSAAGPPLIGTHTHQTDFMGIHISEHP